MYFPHFTLQVSSTQIIKMKTTSLAVALASIASLVAAAPANLALAKRADIDSTILNYALTLEHLEATFYAEGIKNFTQADFYAAGFTEELFYPNLMEIANDEATHVTFLTSAIKAAGFAPVDACTYNFGELTPASFMATASFLEGVGVSAYLGAAALITNKDYLTAAGSILTVEARHNAFARHENHESPFPQPFDAPLDFDEVYSLAAGYIVSCPSTNVALPVKAFPALTVAPGAAEHIPQGTMVKFTVAAGTTLPSGPLYMAWPLVTGPVFVEATVSGSDVTAMVPVGAAGSVAPAGEAFAILTTSNTTLTDDNTVAGPAIVPVLCPYLA